MCTAVCLWGQTCIMVGDGAGAGLAREWIRAALGRSGGAGEQLGAFREYEQASFAERCGFLAIMRGRAAMFEVPPAGRSSREVAPQ